MNPVSNSGTISSQTAISNQLQSSEPENTNYNNWFATTEFNSGNTISASALFDTGSTIEDITSQILSHISSVNSQRSL